jgi:hypothetical protein
MNILRRAFEHAAWITMNPALNWFEFDDIGAGTFQVSPWLFQLVGALRAGDYDSARRFIHDYRLRAEEAWIEEARDYNTAMQHRDATLLTPPTSAWVDIGTLEDIPAVLAYDTHGPTGGQDVI